MLLRAAAGSVFGVIGVAGCGDSKGTRTAWFSSGLEPCPVREDREGSIAAPVATGAAPCCALVATAPCSSGPTTELIEPIQSRMLPSYCWAAAMPFQTASLEAVRLSDCELFPAAPKSSELRCRNHHFDRRICQQNGVRCGCAATAGVD